MRLAVKFTESNQRFNTKFGEVHNISDGGFERGYAQGYTEGEQTAKAEAEAHNAAILTDCNAVLPDKGVEPADTLEQVPQRIGEIKAEPVWLQYITNAYNTFEDATLPDGTIIDITAASFSYTFNNTKGKYEVKLRQVDKTKDLYIGYTFRLCSVKRVDLTETSRRISNGGQAQAFYYAWSLEEIIGAIDFSNVLGCLSCFNLMDALREIRFVPGTIKCNFTMPDSPNLSADSIQSIVDGFADMTGQAAINLTVHRTVGRKMTDEQKAKLTAKNVTLVY